MPSDVTVRIKVPTYIKKYLRAYSVSKTEPFYFENKHMYNNSLVQKISNYNYLKYIPVKDRENVYEYFYHTSNQSPSYEYVEIALPFNRRKDVRSFNYLSRDQKYAFINEVKTDFYTELTRVVMRALRWNVKRKHAIQAFMEKFDLTEDDVKFETLYRQTNRILQDVL